MVNGPEVTGIDLDITSETIKLPASFHPETDSFCCCDGGCLFASESASPL